VVRQGCELTSIQEAERLSTGAHVKEVELVGDRLKYSKLSGHGPPQGWVTTRLKGKGLLVEPLASDSPGPTNSDATLPVPPPVGGRKARILAVHSAPSNSKIMKFQTTLLRKMLGKDFEWLLIDSPNAWEPRPKPGAPPGVGDPAWDLYGAERSEVEKRLAGGKPFLEWLRFEDDASIPSPGSVEKSYQHIVQYIEQESPIDIVVAISQGTAIVSGLFEKMRVEQEDPPWRLSVFFL